MTKATVADAVRTIREGGLVLVLDDEDRENEGDLVMAAEHAAPEAIGFMVRHTSGILCVAMTGERLDALKIPMMVGDNTDPRGTAFTVSVDVLAGTTTGISAGDRTSTIQALIDPSATAVDFARPGHVFPLRYREGGVLKRAGHTEAAVDLAKAAGLRPAGILAEVVNADGTVARRPQLEGFAAEHGIPMITVADLIRHRQRCETLVTRVSEARLPTVWGEARAVVFQSDLDGDEHVAVVYGDPTADVGGEGTLVRVHSECLTGDVLGSLRCDCGVQLQASMQQIGVEGCGVVVYLRGHEGRGIGLTAKMRAYTLQDQMGLDTVDANVALGLPVDSREYGIGAQILKDLGLSRIRLLTNNPAKYQGLEGYDITITGRVPLLADSTVDNQLYLDAKRERMGHLLQAH